MSPAASWGLLIALTALLVVMPAIGAMPASRRKRNDPYVVDSPRGRRAGKP
jgi:hypothetical protein